jgi:hypothetical protein
MSSQRRRGRVKRQEIPSSDGWTTITHGLSNRSVRNKSNAAALPTTTVASLTPSLLLSDFERLREEWRDTAIARQFGALLGKKTWCVDNAVCIGVGSFSRDWTHRYRSLWQLVLFMDVVAHLGKEDGGKRDVVLYAQDPAFTALDRSFLALLSVTVMEMGIEKHITSDTFVFSPFVDWFILLPVFLRQSRPVLYVGNEVLGDYGAVAQAEDKRGRLEECNQLGKRFLERRECVKLQEFERHGSALSGMVVYWLPGENGQEKEEEKG